MQWPLLPAYNPDPGKPSETLTFFLVHQLLAGRVYHLPEEPITEANSHFRVSPTQLSCLSWHLLPTTGAAPSRLTFGFSEWSITGFFLGRHSPIYSLQIGKILDTEERIPPRSSLANQPSFIGLLTGRSMAGSKAALSLLSPLHLESGYATSSAAICVRSAEVLM